MKNQKNVILMYLIAFFQGMVFYAGVATLYREAAGLNLTQITLIESISFAVSLAMELPWGILADRIGYKKTMIVSSGLYFVSKLIFLAARSFPAFLLERIVLSAAIAGLSGVDSSVLFLSAGEENSQKVFGRSTACGTAGMLIASACFSLFLSDRYRLAAGFTAVSYGIAALLTLFLTEVRPVEQEERHTAKEFFSLLKETLSNSRFLLFLLALTLLSDTAQMVAVWLNQDQYLLCGMQQMLLGWAFAGVTIVELVSVFSEPLTKRLGEKPFGCGIFALTAVCCLVLAVTRSALLSFLCVALVRAGEVLLFPLTEDICSRAVTSPDRATQLSIFVLLQDAASALLTPVLGHVADGALGSAFGLSAVLCLLGGFLFFIGLPKRKAE